MPIVKINGLDNRTFKWNDFVIENLSEFGSSIFLFENKNLLRRTLRS